MAQPEHARVRFPRRAGRRVALLAGLDDIPRALVPLLIVDTLGAVAFSNFFVYVAIWGKERLGASDTELGLAYLMAAITSALAGTLGGTLSDRVGRKPVIVCGWLLTVLAALAALASGDHLVLGLASYVLVSGVASIGHGADTALVADLVPPEARERSFAAVRMSGNLGGVLGPSIGAAALALAGWNALFVTAALLGVAATVIGIRYLPAAGAFTPDRNDRTRGALRILLTDARFAAFWVASVLQFVVYTMYEPMLGLSLTQSHGYSVAAWGVMAGVNPLLVVAFQLRITRWSSRASGVAMRLAIATLLMGMPFLLLDASSALPIVIVIIIVFVIGEMIWVPAGQAVAERMSPPTMRGTYLGAFSATGAVAFGIGPLVSLQVRERFGDSAVWTFAALLSAATAILILLIVRRLPNRGDGPAVPVADPT